MTLVTAFIEATSIAGQEIAETVCADGEVFVASSAEMILSQLGKHQSYPMQRNSNRAFVMNMTKKGCVAKTEEGGGMVEKLCRE